jgi:hypothetical protein
MGILMVSVVPMIYAMIRLTRGGAGANTINVAVTAARAYAVRSRPFTTAGATYSGSAILFTPANQLYLIENIEGAADAGSLLETMPTPHNGYGVIAGRDPIKLQNSVNVYGIVRYDNGGNPAVKLVAPPFAIRFDQDGNLVASDDGASTHAGAQSYWVFFDGDIDGNYDTAGTGARPAGYSPDDSNPRIVATLNKDPVTGIYELPFERLEAVIGVLVLPGPEFRAKVQGYASVLSAGSKLPGEINVDDAMVDFAGEPTTEAEAHYRLKQWMLDQGQTLFFSRTTGNLFRETRTR